MNAVQTEAAVEGGALDSEAYLEMYRDMLRIRFFETRVDDLYRRAKMPGLAHLCLGEEAISVGVCKALNEDDYITSTHRGHGHCLAKGAEPERMFAELLGRESGYCGGKGGTMHVADQERNNLGANAIVGGSMGIATGAALSAVRLGNQRVAVCFFGDGALGQGLLYEVMNMAALWKLPVIYVCEDNLYREFTHRQETLVGTLTERAEAFGVPAESVNGQDVHAVYAATARAVTRARAGDGPTFLLCATYRYSGHHVGDIDRSYRTREEESDWSDNRDPITGLERWLTSAGGWTEADLQQVTGQMEQEINDAADRALNAPFPPAAAVDKDVYA